MLTWAELNKQLKELKNEEEVLKIFHEEEKVDPKRPQFLKRIWSRYARLRAKRERKELVA